MCIVGSWSEALLEENNNYQISFDLEVNLHSKSMVTYMTYLKIIVTYDNLHPTIAYD